MSYNAHRSLVLFQPWILPILGVSFVIAGVALVVIGIEIAGLAFGWW